MNTSSRKGAAPPPPPGVGTKIPPEAPHKNGSGPPSLSYSSEPADDENMNEVNEDSVAELYVILPNGKSAQMEVDANIPMIDLLVHLAGRAKLNPSGHRLVVISEETGKNIDYKANQSVGSLDITTIYLVDKKAVSEKNKKNVTAVNKSGQPFEMTYRLTINLPRNQKSVIRINPKVQLHTLYRSVCEDKGLDPNRYTFQHPVHTQQPLDPQMTIGDLQTNEINLVPAGIMPDHAQSMPDLRPTESMRVASPKDQPQSSYMPGSEGKKKSRIFSFFKKEKKYKPRDVSFLETPPSTSSQSRPTGGSPPLRKSAEAKRNDRPKTMFAKMPVEGSGHVETPSNGQVPQGAGPGFRASSSFDSLQQTSEGKVTNAKPNSTQGPPSVPQPPVKSSSSSSPNQGAVKSTPKGHGKKRQAPPPPQQPPTPPQQPSVPPQPTPQPLPPESATKLTAPSAQQTSASERLGGNSSETAVSVNGNVSERESVPNVGGTFELKRPTSAEIRSGTGAVISDVSEHSSNRNVNLCASIEQPTSKRKEDATNISSGVSSEVSVAMDTVTVKRQHSRNSSDSSGYHEATLSGPESPEANRPSLPMRDDTAENLDSTSNEITENGASKQPNTESSPTLVHSKPMPVELNIPSLRSQMREQAERQAREVESAIEEHTLPGEFATLPRHHGNRVEKKRLNEDLSSQEPGLQRSHSLERVNKLVPPQRKKKAPAPPPPPGSENGLAESPQSAEKPVVEELGNFTGDETRMINSCQTHDSGTLNLPPEEESSKHMIMMEDDSVVVEENAPRPSRSLPPMFHPPPPPDTPPPSDTEPVTYDPSSYQMTEVKASGESGEDAAFRNDGDSSIKSSPISMPSRRQSETSKSSISTIEDVNMAFDETIAMAREILEEESDEDGIEYKEEVSTFVDEMNKLTDSIGRNGETHSRSSSGGSLDNQTTTKTFHESFNNVVSRRHGSVSDDDSETRGRVPDYSLLANAIKSSGRQNDRFSDRPHTVESVARPSDYSVSEITYDFKVDAVPPGFTEDAGLRRSTSEEDEEEEITVIEEEIVFTGPSELIKSYKDGAEREERERRDRQAAEEREREEEQERERLREREREVERLERELELKREREQLQELEREREREREKRERELELEREQEQEREREKREWEEELRRDRERLEEREREKREREMELRRDREVLGATVPDWDTGAGSSSRQERSAHMQEEHVARPWQQEEATVRAKMVMVEPDLDEQSRTSYNKEQTADADAINRGAARAEQLRIHSRQHRQQKEQPKEKEEFVFLKADLNKLNFVGPRKAKKPVVTRPFSSYTGRTSSPVTMVAKMERVDSPPVKFVHKNPSPPPQAPVASRPSKAFMVPQPYKQPSQYPRDFVTLNDNSHRVSSESAVYGCGESRQGREKNIRSDLNFPPTTESEMENVLEEKSISMIALPAMRISASDRHADSLKVENDKASDRHFTPIDREPEPEVSTVTVQSEPLNAGGATAVQPMNLGMSPEQQELVNSQYNQMQQQFGMWQQQLVQNQALLAQYKIQPEDQNQQLQQLQLQLQLQQQMMMQLQQSMQTLAMQGAVTSTTSTNNTNNTCVQPVLQSAVSAPQFNTAPAIVVPVVPPQAPPPPPAAPAPAAPPPPPMAASKVHKAQSKPKNKKRFERELDPREELMLAIRQAAGRNCLKKVTVKEARWTSRNPGGEQ